MGAMTPFVRALTLACAASVAALTSPTADTAPPRAFVGARVWDGSRSRSIALWRDAFAGSSLVMMSLIAISPPERRTRVISAMIRSGWGKW